MGAKRQQQRFRVNFSVRFGVAQEFVQEYAENLSTGGLFVRGAHRLTAGETMLIELDLPGFDTFLVTAMVAHILTPEEAAETDRRPGAGLQIVQKPEGFDDAMRDYLLRLGKRRAHMALVAHDDVRTAINNAGYQVRAVPPPNALAVVLGAVDAPVVGVVLSGSLHGLYLPAAEKAGIAELLMTMDSDEDFEKVLKAMDRRLDQA